MGCVGDDIFGEVVIRRLMEWGVDTSYVRIDPNIKTGMGIALCQNNDRAILTYLGSLNAVDPTDVTDDILSLARHLHHGSYFLHTRLRPHIPTIFTRARKLGLSISLDTNWDPDEKWGKELAEILSMVDIFMPNERELQGITDGKDLADCISRIHQMGTPLITIKQGEKGALVSDGSSVKRCSVKPASGGDSIGAGDSFDAGFLAGWLRNLPIEQSLKIGCECGRLVAGAIGGIVGQPTWEEVKQCI